MQNQYVNADSLIDHRYAMMILDQVDTMLPVTSEDYYSCNADFIRFLHGEGQ